MKHLATHLAFVALFIVVLFSIDARAEDTDKLRDHALVAMKKWPTALHEVPHADYDGVAWDIAKVVEQEGPIATREKTPDGPWGPERSVVFLAALGYWEGARFAAYVDEGKCNDWMAEAWKTPVRVPDKKTGVATVYPNFKVLTAEARKLIAFGDCDGGHAYSLWQVWPHGDFTADRLRERREAARAALLKARQSFALRGNLSCYTGELATNHPMADQRERFAARFY
jgi:hypothetical protein